MILWLMFVPIVLISLIVLVYPLLRQTSTSLGDTDEDTRMRTNVVLYRQRLAELDEDKSSGKLKPELYDQLVAELNRGLVDAARGAEQTRASRHNQLGLIVGLVLVVPVASVWLYTQFSPREAVTEWMGVQAELRPKIREIIADPSAMRNLGESVNMRDFFRVMQRYLQSQSHDPKGWSLFSDMMSRLDISEQATIAARKAYEQDPENRQYALRFAQLEMAKNNGKMTPRAERVLRQWRLKSPEDPGVMMLLGMGYFAAEQWPEAVAAWEGLLATLEKRPGEKDEQYTAAINSVRRNLDMARKRINQPEAPSLAATAPQVHVLVNGDNRLLRSAPESARLFVYAKAKTGMPMPIAVKKLVPTAFPVNVVLTVDDAMMPTATLAQHKAVKVFARWSLSGQIMPDAKDIVAESALVNPEERPEVTLDLAAVSDESL